MPPGTRNTMLHAGKDATAGNPRISVADGSNAVTGPCCVWFPAERKISNEQSRGAEDEIKMAPPTQNLEVVFWWYVRRGPEPTGPSFSSGEIAGSGYGRLGRWIPPPHCGGGRKEGNRTNMGEIRRDFHRDPSPLIWGSGNPGPRERALSNTPREHARAREPNLRCFEP
jgi:hypothetical protein